MTCPQSALWWWSRLRATWRPTSACWRLPCCPTSSPTCRQRRVRVVRARLPAYPCAPPPPPLLTLPSPLPPLPLAAGIKLDVEQFLNVVAAPGRMDDFRHAGEVYNFLEAMLKHYTRDEDAEAMCKGLHDLGFWVSLPHEVIERAYQDRNIPDRYCTVALMAENSAWGPAQMRARERVREQAHASRRLHAPPPLTNLHSLTHPTHPSIPLHPPQTGFLIQANEKLAAQVETFTEALKSETQRGIGM